MSKERAAALQTVLEAATKPAKKGETPQEKIERERDNQIASALILVVGDGLDSLDRIACALEDLAVAVRKQGNQ